MTQVTINLPVCTFLPFILNRANQVKRSESMLVFFVSISQYWNLITLVNSFHSHNSFILICIERKSTFHRTFIRRGWLCSLSLNSLCVYLQTSRLILFYSQKLPPFPRLGEQSLTAPVKSLQAERSRCYPTQAQRGFCYPNLQTWIFTPAALGFLRKSCIQKHLDWAQQNAAEFRGLKELLL